MQVAIASRAVVLFLVGALMAICPPSAVVFGADGESNGPFPLVPVGEQSPTHILDWLRRHRDDLDGDISADRLLSLTDLALVLRLSDYLIDKNKESFRSFAADSLGRLGHKYGMPALLAVFRDESESRDLRADCIIALSKIPDGRVVEILIDEGIGESIEFDINALAGLVNLVGRPPELHGQSYGNVKAPPEDPAAREEYLEIWRTWWKENQNEIKLKREIVWLH